MHPNKKIITLIISILFSLVFFSGCTILNIFGTSFSLNSYSICDNQGFGGAYIDFSASGTVSVKTYGTDDTMIDSEKFFHGNQQATMNIVKYRNSIKPGEYTIKSFDKDDNLISTETFSCNGADINVDSVDQKWWKREAWKGGYTLIGLVMTVSNNGDAPAYPYTVDVVMGTETVSGYVLPCVVLPGQTSTVKAFVYKEDTPTCDEFTIDVKDIDDEIYCSNTFDIQLEDNVEVIEFRFTYNGRSLRLKLPYPDFLYDYYTSLDRIAYEDYSFYVFDKYDDHYLDLLSNQLQYSSSSQTDADKINFAASFIQNLKYKEDTGQYDYPNYPLETLFNREDGCDCEDMSILTASVLDRMGYDVALFRFTNHMSVGVKLNSGIPGYDVFDSGYYYLETTSKDHKVGYIPSQYVSKPDFKLYEITSRPILLHNWYNNNLTIYYNTEQGNVVKVTCIVSNLGSSTAEDVKVEGVFITPNGLEFREEEMISSIDPGMKEKTTFMINIPSDFQTSFETRVYLGSTIADTVESASTFP